MAVGSVRFVHEVAIVEGLVFVKDQLLGTQLTVLLPWERNQESSRHAPHIPAAASMPLVSALSVIFNPVQKEADKKSAVGVPIAWGVVYNQQPC